MSRRVFHIAVALLTFTVGFVAAGELESLSYALPLALLAFCVASFFLKDGLSSFDSHMLKVGALTFLLWIPILLIFVMLTTPRGGCTLDASEDRIAARRIEAEPVPEDAVITLKRTFCRYGSCPVYSVSIFEDGAVFFHSFDSRSVKGAANGRISREQLRRLIAEFERADYFSLNEKYDRVGDGCKTVSSDGAWVVTSIRLNGRKKVVEHYLGCMSGERERPVFPQKLTELEERIEEIAGVERWMKDGEEAQNGFVLE